MSKSQIILKLSPVNHYQRLSNHEDIKNLLSIFQKDFQLNRSNCDQCFIHLSSFKDALLFASLCFGGLSFLSTLRQFGINLKDIDIGFLQKQMSKFEWDQQKETFQIFSQNSNKIGAFYPFYCSNILTKIDILSLKQFQNFFRKIVNTSPYLYGVKIRTTSKSPKCFSRDHQQLETDRVHGKKYLIFNQIQSGHCILGMIYYKLQTNITLVEVKKKEIQSPSLSNLQKTQEEEQQMVSTYLNTQLKKQIHSQSKKLSRCPCQLF